MKFKSKPLVVGALTVALGAAAFFLPADHARATVWNVGDLTTYTQPSWGDDTLAAAGAILLTAHYNDVYSSTFDLVTVGSSSGHTMTFTDAAHVLPYLPSIGAFGPLNGNTLNAGNGRPLLSRPEREFVP